MFACDAGKGLARVSTRLANQQPHHVMTSTLSPSSLSMDDLLKMKTPSMGIKRRGAWRAGVGSNGHTFDPPVMTLNCLSFAIQSTGLNRAAPPLICCTANAWHSVLFSVQWPSASGEGYWQDRTHRNSCTWPGCSADVQQAVTKEGDPANTSSTERLSRVSKVLSG